MLGWVGLLLTVGFELVRVSVQLTVLLTRVAVWLFVMVLVPMLRLSAEGLGALAGSVAHWAVRRREMRQ